jgi:hypothetical protein
MVTEWPTKDWYWLTLGAPWIPYFYMLNKDFLRLELFNHSDQSQVSSSVIEAIPVPALDIKNNAQEKSETGAHPEVDSNELLNEFKAYLKENEQI